MDWSGPAAGDWPVVKWVVMVGRSLKGNMGWAWPVRLCIYGVFGQFGIYRFGVN